MGHLTLREALASRQLDAFVREQQDNGAELVAGSELERGLALLVTQRRLLVAKMVRPLSNTMEPPRPLGSEFRAASPLPSPRWGRVKRRQSRRGGL